MISDSVILEMDRVIKSIWENEIYKDYQKYYLLREDSVKCALYFHIRKKLDKLLKENNLRIYPEFYIKKLKYRPDIVIAEIDPDLEMSNLKDCVISVPVIIEIKLEGRNSRGTYEVIMKDINKAKTYLKTLSDKSQCYLAIIYESECSTLNWMNKKATNN